MPPADARKLVTAACAARTRAVAPYSHRPVGAALATEQGIFTGANRETLAAPRICAEQAALAAARTGGARRITAVAIVAAEPQPPCPRCHDLLAAAAPNLEVISPHPDGRLARWTLESPPPSAQPEVVTARRRARMVDTVRAAGWARQPRTLAALEAVKRHQFLPARAAPTAYRGQPVVLARSGTGIPTSVATMPAAVALMVERLDVRPGHNVLEIGTGSGYSSALLAYLAGPTGRVTSIEINRALVQAARSRLEAAGYSTVSVLHGDGWYGMGHRAPFDRILMTAGTDDLSPYWLEQLAPHGVLVAPMWLGAGIHLITAFRRERGRILGAVASPGYFTPLLARDYPRPATARIDDDVTARFTQHHHDDSAILRRLLRHPPDHRLPTGPLPRGWFHRVALTEPLAVALHAGTRLRGYGLFDPAAPSLAVVAASTLLGYGTTRTLRQLQRHLAHTAPQRLAGLRVEVFAPCADSPGRARWVLARRWHDFLLNPS